MVESTGTNEMDRLPVWSAQEEWCAVTTGMNVIGYKWHPVIIDRLLKHETLRFNELSREIGGAITNKVLSSSLEDLEEKDLIERSVVNEKPVEVEYSLTPRGESLEPVIESLETWAQKNFQPAASQTESIVDHD
ncbi:winged helix-turn-helix transcriptional regulator [Haloarcula amylolytica]|uniref:winged helix-turn-helix transcriptional regulator n=1 Tax=Haloarcula amylolytica TaxID=396317 RepID=UPI003C73F3BF